jgi:hypothetical protein
VVSCSSMRFTMTRSWSGVRFTAILKKPPYVMLRFELRLWSEKEELALLVADC